MRDFIAISAWVAAGRNILGVCTDVGAGSNRGFLAFPGNWQQIEVASAWPEPHSCHILDVS